MGMFYFKNHCCKLKFQSKIIQNSDMQNKCFRLKPHKARLSYCEPHGQGHNYTENCLWINTVIFKSLQRVCE